MNKPSLLSRLPIQHRVAGVLLVIAAALLLVAVMSSLVFGSCSAGADSRTGSGAGPSGKPQSGLATATLRSGAVDIVVELALSPSEQETGLMGRKELADGRGMLFIYDDDRMLSFWMKNTLIPLSIAYLGSDGTIKEIRDMEPGSLAPVESGRYVRYALEAPLGWFGRVGLDIGDRFDMSGLPARE